MSLYSQKYGFEIRDPGSRGQKGTGFRIPDSNSQHWALHMIWENLPTYQNLHTMHSPSHILYRTFLRQVSLRGAARRALWTGSIQESSDRIRDCQTRDQVATTARFLHSSLVIIKLNPLKIIYLVDPDSYRATQRSKILCFTKVIYIFYLEASAGAKKS